jgi:flagellar biosynthesis protein FlhF
MRIRRFIARNSQEALRKVRESMGPEAVILGSRTLAADERPGGGPLLEVTAAADLDSLARPRQESGAAATDGCHEEKWRWLEQEIQQLKEVLWSSEARSILEERAPVNSSLRHLYAAFRELGLHTTFIRPILEECQAKTPGGDGRAGMTNWLQQALMKLLERVEVGPLAVGKGEHRIWSFIGPTGVGKTTTMAKLAAKTALQQGRRVALITVDQHRIGAIDQMAAYAQIMNLPLETATSAEQLARVIGKHRDKEVLFIDTAGRSPSQQDDLNELKAIFRIPRRIEHQLVLSATTQYQDLIKAAAAFQPLECSNYIFTKLDETSDGATIMNFLISRPRPVSYVTTGQRVPEDIEPASRKRLAALLLQGRRVTPGLSRKEARCPEV